MQSIDFQENSHRMNPCSFIAIIEAMIFRDSITQPCGFVKNRRMQFYTAVTLERRMNCRFQKGAIVNPGTHNRIFSNIFVKLNDIRQ